MSSSTLPRTIALIALAIVAALTAIVSPASAAPRTTPYKLPADFALPNDLVAGPDGAMWVTDSSLGRIWKIAKTGKIRHYDLGQMPGGITTASGSLWVADSGGDAIHRVETDGSSTTYPLPAGAFPIDIVQGADGALWFTEGRGDKIGRITTDGHIDEYPLPTTGAFAADIAAGPDGAVYFSESSAGKVGRITMAGEITEHAMPGDAALPGPIVSIDGVLYVSDRNNNTIDRMTTAGQFTDAFELPRENADPLAMVAGVDGALYISEHMTGSISRMTIDGTFTKRYKVPGGWPDSIANGPDGALWVGQGNIGQVVRLDVGLDAPVTASATTLSARAGVTATHSVVTFTDADPNARPRDYAVTINWGDGEATGGWVRRAADGSFVVRGRHTYEKKGTRKVVVRITDGVGKGLDAKVTSTAVVSK
jgi:virginiamycin B lyase